MIRISILFSIRIFSLSNILGNKFMFNCPIINQLTFFIFYLLNVKEILPSKFTHLQTLSSQILEIVLLTSLKGFILDNPVAQFVIILSLQFTNSSVKGQSFRQDNLGPQVIVEQMSLFPNIGVDIQVLGYFLDSLNFF